MPLKNESYYNSFRSIDGYPVLFFNISMLFKPLNQFLTVQDSKMNI